MTTATKPARTQRLIENGHAIYASDGGVAQEGPLPIYICNACRSQVVWATSSRTGRKYLVSISHSQSGARFYIKRNAHPRDCGERLEAELAEVRAWKEKQAEIAAARIPTIERVQRRYERALEMMAARPQLSGGGWVARLFVSWKSKASDHQP